jgi:hypothetical protein
VPRPGASASRSTLLYLFDLVVAEHPDMGWQRDKIGVGEVFRAPDFQVNP